VSVPLLATTRNAVVERLERGHCVVCDPRGEIVWAAGDPEHVTYLRSSAKPMQATALVRSGAMERFGLDARDLAVACGSHRGEPRHVETVLHLLRHAGVSPTALQCGTHDLRASEAAGLAGAHLAPTPLHNNCSGKHAGMLAAAQALGSPLGTYLAVDHPVQRLILDAISACAGVPPTALHLGVDGCSAPNPALTMRQIATCYARIADPAQLPRPLGTAIERVAAAMLADPWLVHGTGCLDTALMASLGGAVVSKGGAEGLQCVTMPALGLGLAVKFESGRADGIGAVVLALLRALGVVGSSVPPGLAAFDSPPIRNHRDIQVGETRLLLELPPEPARLLRQQRA
jgi:L-asparaginase II